MMNCDVSTRHNKHGARDLSCLPLHVHLGYFSRNKRFLLRVHPLVSLARIAFVFLCSCHRAFRSLWHHFLQFRNSDRLPATRVLTSHELGHYCTTNLWNWICRGMLLTRSLRTQKAGLSLSPRWYSTSSSLTACCAKPRLLPRWMRSLYIRLL